MGWLRAEEVTGGGTWTVGELTAYIRELFEIDFRLQDVQVQGEISNFTRARSGHLYFTLKDPGAQLKCVMWRSQAGRLAWQPGDGDAVVAQGRVTVYEAGGAYQLYATDLAPAGRGDLAQAFERLKQKLADEGLFDPDLKQGIPPLPHKIGVVTSADAAAWRDIMNVLRRRFPLVSVLLAPTLVQGPEAPAQIVQALRWLDGRTDVDTIIVARGGGSLEDLWAFNDESVARAIFAARHPIICGVGHEIDFTIADFVADLRAPTPSAAAELAVPDRLELMSVVTGHGVRLHSLISLDLRERGTRVARLARELQHLGPGARLAGWWQTLDNLSGRLDLAWSRRLDRAQGRLALARAQLETVSPMATLARGYAIVRRAATGRLVRAAREVPLGEGVEIQLAEGALSATVIGVEHQDPSEPDQT